MSGIGPEAAVDEHAFYWVLTLGQEAKAKADRLGVHAHDCQPDLGVGGPRSVASWCTISRVTRCGSAVRDKAIGQRAMPKSAKPYVTSELINAVRGIIGEGRI
jgi:hypothetical protein